MSSVIALVEDRLAALRRQLAAWFWVDGLMRVGWTAIGLIVLDLGIDYLVRFDFAQRLIMLVLMVGVLVYVARRWLILPLSADINDDALCLAIEEQNPEVKQSLISALQFSRLEGIENRGMSVAMVKQTIAQGLQWADRLNFGEVLDRGARLRNIGLLAVAIVLLVATGVGIAAQTPLRLWFERNILLTEAEWPHKTYLKIEGAENGKVVFPRGGEWNQVVTVEDRSEVVPDTVFLEFRYARGRAPQPMKKTGDKKFEALFANVLEPFSFRARGGDDVTPWVRVELVEPPNLDQLELDATLPGYAGGTVESLPAGRGPYFVLKGSTLTLVATSNKPLMAAQLLIDGKPHQMHVADDGKGHSIVTGKIPDAPPGQYVIDLEDQLGLHPLQPIAFGIRPRIDREPRVKGKFVGVGTMGMISVKARLPVSLRITDDFGLSKAMTQFKLRAEEEARNKDGEMPFEALKDKPLTNEVAFEDVLEVMPLGLVAGDALTLIFAAADNDSISGPNIGKSSEFQLRIVTEEELRAEMLRREKEQRQEFERLVKTQEELLTDTKALGAETQPLAEMTPEQRNQLMQIMRRQKLIATNTSSIAERLDLVVLEALNNRVEEEGGEMERRLRNSVITPMLVIVKDEVPDVGTKLEAARRLSADQSPRHESLTAAIAAQEKLLAHMREVLGYLIQAEGFQEAINLILEISRAEQDVLERTEKEKKERLQKLLDEAKKNGQPAPAPAPEEKPENKPAPSGDKEDKSEPRP
jgi:hypothetical protein